MVHFLARRFNQAIVEYRKAVDIEPRPGGAHPGVAMYHAAAGRKTEALAAADKATAVDAVRSYWRTRRYHFAARALGTGWSRTFEVATRFREDAGTSAFMSTR